MSTDFDTCQECGKKFRNRAMHIHFRERLCWNCYRKRTTIIKMPLIFQDDMNRSLSVALTRNQKKIIDERVQELYPNQNKCRGKYIRELIFKDLRECNKMKDEDWNMN